MEKKKRKRPRERQLNLTLSAEELETVRARAAALGLRAGTFGRLVLLDPQVKPAPSHEPDYFHRTVHQQLIRLGSNLNQMMRYFYKTGDPVPADLEPLLNDIRSIIARFAP
jgi:hypothetical protein